MRTDMLSSRWALLATFVATSACATELGEEVSAGDESALTDGPSPLALGGLGDAEARLVRVGASWVDRPSAFLGAQETADVRARLQRRQGYVFSGCEARGVLPATSDPAQCTYLLDAARGYQLEYFVRGFEPDGRACPILSQTCRPHQAIRVRAWNDGVQRPALFMEERALADDELSFVMVRPNVDKPDAAVTFAPGFSFARDDGARIASDLGVAGRELVNMIHLSNVWLERREQLQLQKARAQFFAIVSLALGGSTFAGGLAVLRGGAAVTTIAKVGAFLDVAAGASIVVAGGVELFGLRDLESTLPEGSPERRAVGLAIAIANVSPYLGNASFGLGVLRGAGALLMRAQVLTRVAKIQGVPVGSLDKALVRKLTAAADQRAFDVVRALATGRKQEAARIMVTYSREVASDLSRLRPIPSRPYIPSGAQFESELLTRQQSELRRFKASNTFGPYTGVTAPPTGVKPELRGGYQRIIDFVRAPDRVFARMQQLEIEVAKRMKLRGETQEQALEAVLTALERKHGFPAVQDIKNLTREIIESGTPFRDLGFSPKTPHGQQIHRVQWNLILREIDAAPGGFAGKPGVAYYKEFANPQIEGDWYKPWNDLFDSFDGSAGQPETWRNLRDFLPTLGGWD